MKHNVFSTLTITLLVLLVIQITPAQDTSIPPDLPPEEEVTILFPQNNITYGPWSETYIYYPKTKSNAHQIQVKLAINQENVAYYQLFSNGKPIVHAAPESNTDESQVLNFPASDLIPVTLVGPITTLNNLTVVAYDENNNAVATDSVIFFLSINIEDYFEILEKQESGEAGYTILPEDIAKIGIKQEVVEESSLLFDIKKEYTYLTVRDKFTGNEKEHTAIKLTLTPKTPGVNVTLYNLIPKQIVEDVNELVLEGNYTIIDPDPLMMWQFAMVQEPMTLEYNVEKKLEKEEIEAIKAITVTTKTKTKRSLFYFLIPVLLIPMIMFTVIYFSRFQHHKE